MRGLRIVANRHKQGNYIWLCCICVANKDQITCMSCYVVYPVYSACQAVSCFRNWDLYRYHCLLETSHSSSKVGKFMSNATPQTNRSFCYISMESIASSFWCSYLQQPNQALFCLLCTLVQLAGSRDILKRLGFNDFEKGNRICLFTLIILESWPCWADDLCGIRCLIFSLRRITLFGRSN